MDASGPFEAFLSRIESPALRAVALHWHGARGTRPMPSWGDLTSPAGSPYPNMLWGYDFDPVERQIKGRLAGERFRKWIGEDFFGGRLEDIYPPSNAAEVHPYLIKVVTTPAAFWSSGRLFKVGDITVTGERIILPIAEDGTTGDGILGASSYTPPPLLGPVQLFHENVEYYMIDRP